MIALQILDIKNFMKKLLADQTFDSFLISEATITTFNTFTIHGQLHKDFYSEAELIEAGLESVTMSYWRQIRPVCFDLVKGRKTPLGFKFIFQLAPNNTARLLQQAGLDLDPSAVAGLFLNIKYENQKLQCITGTSLNVFTMDKSLDHAWDDMVRRFFRKQEIPFEEI